VPDRDMSAGHLFAGLILLSAEVDVKMTINRPKGMKKSYGVMKRGRHASLAPGVFACGDVCDPVYK